MYGDETRQGQFGVLTEREREITQLIAEGWSNREIARDLALSYETIKWYTKRIYSKLHISNRTQLILLVQQSGLEDHPPQPAACAVPKALPRTLTRFIGRQREFDELNGILRHERLVTLVGAGGVGKTRLAVEISAYQQQLQSVHFIALHAVDSVDQFIAVLSYVFGIMLSPPDEPFSRLLSALPKEPVLLILDNFETLVDAAPLLPQMLQRAEQMTMLVTSRAVLRLRAEYVYRIEGLLIDGTDADGNAAVDLFCERAAHHLPQSQILDNLPVILEICRLLEGSPLGIELAASWLRTLMPEQILSDLQRGLMLLQANFADADERHHSMAAVCEHSWHMLNEQEQAVFMRLSVFRGGFTSEAGYTVSESTMLILSHLVDKSILRVTESGRYQIHDLLRVFARQRLDKNPDQAKTVRQHHATYFIQLMAEAETGLRGVDVKAALQTLETEYDNVMDAWHWFADNGATKALDDALQPLTRFLSITDRSRQGAALFTHALEHAAEDTKTYAGLLLFRGWHKIWLGETDEGTQDMLQALALLDQLHPSSLWAMPISLLSFHEGFDAATRQALVARYERDLAIYLRSGDEWDAAWMEYGLGNFARADHSPKESIDYLRCSLGRFQAAGDFYGQTWALDALSTTCRRIGAYDAALNAGEQLKAISEMISYSTGMVIAYEIFGDVAQASNDYEAAYAHYRQGLLHALKNADPTTIIPMLLSIAKLLVAHSDLPKFIAIELFALVKAHPSSQTGWFASRHVEAKIWLETLYDQEMASGYYAAVLRAQSAELIATTRLLLENVLPLTLWDRG